MSIAARRGSLGALGLSVAPIGFQVVTLRTPPGSPSASCPSSTGGRGPAGCPRPVRAHHDLARRPATAASTPTSTSAGLHIRPATPRGSASPRSAGRVTSPRTPTTGTFVRVRAAGTERVLRAHGRRHREGGLHGAPGGRLRRHRRPRLPRCHRERAGERPRGRSPADVTPPAPPAPGSVRLRPVDPRHRAASFGPGRRRWPATSAAAAAWPASTTRAYAGAAEPGTYRDCGVRFVWLERHPEYRPGGAYPVQGTLVVRPGEETTGDVAIDLTPPD